MFVARKSTPPASNVSINKGLDMGSAVQDNKVSHSYSSIITSDA